MQFLYSYFLHQLPISCKLQAAITSDEKVVKAARFENTWMPSIQLKGLEIAASRFESTIVEVTSYEGSLIKSIQMNSVTILSLVIYDYNEIKKVGFAEPSRAQYLSEVVLYNDEDPDGVMLIEV